MRRREPCGLGHNRVHPNLEALPPCWPTRDDYDPSGPGRRSGLCPDRPACVQRLLALRSRPSPQPRLGPPSQARSGAVQRGRPLANLWTANSSRPPRALSESPRVARRGCVTLFHGSPARGLGVTALRQRGAVNFDYFELLCLVATPTARHLSAGRRGRCHACAPAAQASRSTRRATSSTRAAWASPATAPARGLYAAA
jgi:hypothetical protein